MGCNYYDSLDCSGGAGSFDISPSFQSSRCKTSKKAAVTPDPKAFMEIHIKNLKIKAIIGINDWERKEKQEVIVNVELEVDAFRATQTDRIEDTLNYKTLTKRIISEVESSEFYLLEKLANHIIKIVLEDKKAIRGTVEVDKPQALRFADSVSIRCSGERGS